MAKSRPGEMKGSAVTNGQETEVQVSALEDGPARSAALDTSRSFLVQAPAGSGKTELLTRRFLKLLAEVDEPEQVLAITFTRAATAEMRTRVLDALEEAAHPTQPGKDDPLGAIASAALKNNAARGWRLLEQPQRLNIQTIDSLCMSIAHRTPLLSRLGGSLTPTEHAEPLYALAARRTLARLGGERPELSTAIRALLELRDTSLGDCEQLVAGMLERRDQWGPMLTMVRESSWEKLRSKMEEPFVHERNRLIAKAHALLGRDAGIGDELLDLAAYACRNLEREERANALFSLRDVTRLDHLQEPEHWKAVCHFLLAGGKQWRKKLDVRLGFPAEGRGEKERYNDLIGELKRVPGSLELLCELPKLPPPRYSSEQWELLEHILLILHYAAAELRVIFAEQSVVDFVELGLAARQALEGEQDGHEAGLPAAQQWRHLLVDEFQDTSRGQYQLLTLLIEQWDSSEPGTCFLVGDPMQSIYGFRLAEVELFERTRRHGLGENLHLQSLVLQTNFRSHAGLVSKLNEFFSEIFAAPSADRYQVSFAPSVASKPAPRGAESVHVKAQFLPSKTRPEEGTAAEEAEAEEAVRIVERTLGRDRNGEELRIAVLVRARNHLVRIARKLRAAGIPYRAVEIEELRERQEVLDLTSLVRCLLHPMDRIAWLSVLRAPWCGLTLQDLHILCGQDAKELAKEPMLQLLRMRLPLLSADGQERAARVSATLEDALRGKHRQSSFAQWVERVWQSLGGRECVDRTGYENVRAFFRMLAELPPDGTGLDDQLERLFAEPDPKTNELSGVQLMTIHKAKGLGFDVVIVPGLQRETFSRDQPLLSWLERTTLEGPEETEQREFLVAPIGRKGDDADPLYRWITRQKDRKEREEAKRLLYVACTRAKEELYLLGTATVKGQTNGSESVEPGKGQNLLKTAWPALKKSFELQRERQCQEKQDQERQSQEREGQEIHGSKAEVPAQSVLPFPAPGPTIENAALTARTTLKLRRLPANWQPRREQYAEILAEPQAERHAQTRTAVDESGPGGSEASEARQFERASVSLFERPIGSLKARALGVVVHALFEELTLGLTERGADELAAEAGSWRPRSIALLRHAGLSAAEAETQSVKVVEALKSALEDETGRWILAARNEAETETSWTAWTAPEEGSARLATLRGDRIFRAGAEPQSWDETHLWIVDYKTAQHGAAGLDAFLEEEKKKYRDQLEAYGEVMRHVHGEKLPMRLALYYPLLKRLLWWEAP
jgi:ATP-dependent helicase/nuclease subunit A